MKPGNKELMDLLNGTIKELQRGINVHCCLVRSILEGRISEGNGLPEIKIFPGNRREQLLKEALKETIIVLEESRKAFKSKQLEALRKKLTQVLIDVN